MRNSLLLLTLCFFTFQLEAQNKPAFFLAPSLGGGINVKTAQIYPGNDFRWETNPEYFGSFEGGKRLIPFQAKGGIDLGLSWRDRLFVFTGIGYTMRRDEGYPSCDFCDMALPEFTTRLAHDFWEIPIGVNFLLTKEKRINPFIGASALYTLSVGNHGYKSLAWQWRLGVSFPMADRISLQSALYLQHNRNAWEPSHYAFQEMGLQVSLVKIFRQSD